jgi:peptide/nickel transport system substrate-binding protein
MKRKLALMLAVVMIIASLSACGSKNESTTGSSTAESQTSESEGGKQVVIGINADYSTFDPANAYEKSGDMVLLGIYDNLVSFEGEDLTSVVPEVAEKWEVSDDHLIYTFTLREDVVATTGKTLNAEDVVYCFNRLKNLKGNPSFLMDNVESVEATGEFEVTLTLKEADASILAMLAKPNFAIYDSEACQANGGTGEAETDTAQQYLDTTSIGSGVYKLTSYTPNAELVLEKNDTHFGDQAKVDKIIFKHINDPSTQMMMLQKGDIDFAFDLDAEQLNVVKSDENLQLIESSTMDIFFLMLNMDETIGGPLANDKVREAIRYAIDYEGMRTIAGNNATTPYNIIPDGFAGSLGESEITRDLDKAKELMAEAGYADGFTISCAAIPQMATDGVSFMSLAEKVQADLAEIGITVEISSEEVSVYLENYRNGNHQSNIGMWGPDYVDPANQLAFLPGQTTGLRANWTEEMDPELAALVSAAKQETDDAKRAEIYEEIQQKYEEANGPFIVLLQPGRVLAANKRVTNAVYTAADQLQINTLDVE